MKNYIVAASLLLATSPLIAQKISASDVPASAKTSLEKNFSIKDAKWDKEGSNYEANFKKNGKEMSVVYDAGGVLVETEEEIAKSGLPTAVQDFLKKDFADYKLEEMAKITSKGVISYEVEIEKGEDSFELIFDSKGSLLKKEQEKEEDKD